MLKPVKPMQNNNRHPEVLQALAAGTNPITGEVLPADRQSNQREIIRALVSRLTNSKPPPKR